MQDIKATLYKELKDQGYLIEQELTVDSFGRAHGIVKNSSGDVFFVKAVGSFASYAYNALKNEISVTKYIAQKTHSTPVKNSNFRLLVPKVAHSIVTKDMVCMISEYIEGEHLINSDLDTQRSVLLNTMNLFEKMNRNLHNNVKLELRESLKDYGKFNVFIRIFPMVVKSILFNPKHIFNILKLALNSMWLPFYQYDMGIVHADINMSNIIYTEKNKEKRIYLLDWEESGYGIFGLNYIGPLSVHWMTKEIRKDLLSLLNSIGLNYHLLLIYRTLLLLSQNISHSDSRRKRDIELLKFLS